MKFELDELAKVINAKSVYFREIGKVLGRDKKPDTETYVLGFEDGRYTGNFTAGELEKVGEKDAHPFDKARVTVTKDNISTVAEWCGGEIRGKEDHKYIMLKTGFTDHNPDYRTSLHVGDMIEKRDDGKFQIWVGGEPKDADWPKEDRPYMKKGRDFYPLAEAVAFVNAGFYDGELATDDVYVVWFCSALQNWKALVSTNVKDNCYYEVTHNGDKNETYVDKYVKTHQMVVDRETDKATLTNVDNFAF